MHSLFRIFDIIWIFERKPLLITTHMMMQKTLAITTLLVSPALATDKWGWTAAENLCAGIVTNCNDKSSCTKVGVGPCEGTATTAPTAYLTSEFVGMAFVDQDKYLEDATQMKVLDATGPGYRDFKAGLKLGNGGGEYSRHKHVNAPPANFFFLFFLFF